MTRFTSYLALPLLFLVVGCATPPRTLTAEERQTAHQTLLNVETALIVLKAAGKINEEDFNLAISQVNHLRQEVENAAVKPIDWAFVLQQITNLAVQWVIPPAPENPDA